ncbi:hypothetical protein BSKO_01667 [Bryopsis sp. KO-2023]|nr:hypothetical protein BSKO_01667 [Bryopsis sp. KO-2023]
MVGTSLRMVRSKGVFLVGILLVVGGCIGAEGRLGAPRRRLLTPGCGEGEFQKFYDGTCMTCDENCVPGKCVDEAGCDECQKGYFKSRVDIFWPYACHKCKIENCERCMDNFFDDWEPKCEACIEGFVLNSNFTACDPKKEPATKPKLVLGTTETRNLNDEDEEESITTSTTFKTGDDDISTSKTFKSTDDVVSTSKTFKTRDEISTSKTFTRTTGDEVSTSRSSFINDDDVSTSTSTFKRNADDEDLTSSSTTKKVEETKKKKEVLGTTEERRKKKSDKCDVGSFLKKHDKTCMTCDPKCAANKCVDFEGCKTCKLGYYRSRVDDFWPFECIKCVDKIPNCAVCKGGKQIYHQLGTTCLKCKKGYQIGQNGRACISK